VDRPLRLISADTIVGTPIDALARTIEALLVVASQPLTVDELAAATADDAERVETALGLLREHFAETRSGIVLERVSGGYAFRASREAAEACGRLFERPVERGLSQAALETLAIVAYKQPVSRAQVSAIRGVNVDATLKTLEARGYIEETGHDHTPGNPSLFGTTRMFLERLGLDSVDQLPSLAEFIPEASVVEALERGLRIPTADEVVEELVDDDEAAAEVEVVEVVGDDASEATVVEVDIDLTVED
jgi:segregation and condensation protein B